MQSLTPFLLLLLLLPLHTHSLPQKKKTACTKAFDACKFTFVNRNSDLMFDHRFPDKSYTPDITFKNTSIHIGVVSSNYALEGDFILPSGKAVPFSKMIPQGYGKKKVKPFDVNVFRPYMQTTLGMYSGIGHEKFEEEQKPYASGKCVRVWITDWQVLDGKRGGVAGNVVGKTDKKEGYCVVFRNSAVF